MPIDFSKPVTTDRYDTGVLPQIKANFSALSQWLDAGVVAVGGDGLAEVDRHVVFWCRRWMESVGRKEGDRAQYPRAVQLPEPVTF